MVMLIRIAEKGVQVLKARTNMERSLGKRYKKKVDQQEVS